MSPLRSVFAIGYMHSGTTLLLKLLGNHPDVFPSAGETKFFEMLPLLRKRYPDVSTSEGVARFAAYAEYLICHGDRIWKPDEVESSRTLCCTLSDEELDGCRGATHAGIFRQVFAVLARRAGKGCWLEKSPNHVFYVTEILSEVPDAMFLEITRDPRDVLSSKKVRRETVWTTKRYSESQRGYKNLEKAYDPIWDTVSWKAAIRAGSDAKVCYPDRVLRLRYEDLVATPEIVARQICGFLGLPYSSYMLDVPEGNTAYVDTRTERTVGVHRGSLGRWKETLKPAEVHLCQMLAARELQELGHNLAPIGLTARLNAYPLFFPSGLEFGSRLLRRWRMGGFRFMANIMRNYGRRALKLLRSKRTGDRVRGA